MSYLPEHYSKSDILEILRDEDLEKKVRDNISQKLVSADLTREAMYNLHSTVYIRLFNLLNEFFSDGAVIDRQLEFDYACMACPKTMQLIYETLADVYRAVGDEQERGDDKFFNYKDIDVDVLRTMKVILDKYKIKDTRVKNLFNSDEIKKLRIELRSETRSRVEEVLGMSKVQQEEPRDVVWDIDTLRFIQSLSDEEINKHIQALIGTQEFNSSVLDDFNHKRGLQDEFLDEFDGIFSILQKQEPNEVLAKIKTIVVFMHDLHLNDPRYDDIFMDDEEY